MVRALVGGIGLVASVPITTLIAALVATRDASPAASRDRRRLSSEQVEADVVEWWRRLRDA